MCKTEAAGSVFLQPVWLLVQLGLGAASPARLS